MIYVFKKFSTYPTAVTVFIVLTISAIIAFFFSSGICHCFKRLKMLHALRGQSEGQGHLVAGESILEVGQAAHITQEMYCKFPC